MIILADWIDIVTVSIAVLALLFTLFSTWWLYFRRGRIMVPKPRAIEAGGSYDDKLVIGVPLVFANSGPATRVVRNLRLRIEGDSDSRPLSWQRTRREIMNPENSEFARPFPVQGRDAVEKLIQFQRDLGRLDFQAQRYEFVVEGRLDNTDKWQPLTAFHLDVKTEDVPRMKGRLATFDLEGE